MAKIGGAFVCLLIVVMDIVAGVVGIQAEMAQNKVHHLKFLIFECKDPSEQAFRLGLAAAGILALAHVIANLLGGCMCICSKEEFVQSSANRQLAVACLFLSWIILAVGFSMLLIHVQQQDEDFVRVLPPQFLVDRRYSLLRSWAFLRCILRLCECDYQGRQTQSTGSREPNDLEDRRWQQFLGPNFSQS